VNWQNFRQQIRSPARVFAAEPRPSRSELRKPQRRWPLFDQRNIRSQSSMASCALCNDLTKRHEDHLGLNFEFTLKQLNHSAVHHNCSSCLILWEGLRQARCEDWTLFEQRTRIIYARCLGEHGGFAETLQLIISFLDDSPSLQLEFYSLVPHSTFLLLAYSQVDSLRLTSDTITSVKSNFTSTNNQQPSPFGSRAGLGTLSP
jgi:hypothetical protein